MMIFRVIGVGLIILGSAAGAVIFLTPFGLRVSGSAFAFWVFFALCFVGGFVLYALGAREASAAAVLKTAGGILLILGLLSACAIFLAKVGLGRSEVLETTQNLTSLWFLFLICTPAGMVAVLAAERLHGQTVSEFLPDPVSTRGASPRPRVDAADQETHNTAGGADG